MRHINDGLKQLFPIRPLNLVQDKRQENAHDYLNPPIRNIGYKGIVKMSDEILKWPSRSNIIEHDLCLTALLMERAGTGGALFRNLYRDFLKESAELLEEPKIEQAHSLFSEIAPMWVSVSASIDRAGRTGDYQELSQASKLLLENRG